MNYPIQTVDQLAPTLKAFRRAAGMTQAELAARLGITQQTYARLEANPQVVSLARFLRVLSVLGVQMTLGAEDATTQRQSPTNTWFSGDQSSPPAARHVQEAAARYAAPTATRKQPEAGASASAKRPAAAKRKPARQDSDSAPEQSKQPKPVVSRREQW